MSTDQTSNHPIVLYDGVCGVCNRFVQFVLTRDPLGRFRFASLQSRFAARVLGQHGRDPSDLSTIYVVVREGEGTPQLLQKASAVLFILARLGGLWMLCRPLAWCPVSALDVMYDLLARRRYRILGRLDRCAVPSEEWKERFVEV